MAKPIALDLRILADAFPPTTSVHNPNCNPAKSSATVLLPTSILNDLLDPEYIPKLRHSTRVAPIDSVPPSEVSATISLADALRSDSHKGQLFTDPDNRTWTTNDAGAYASTSDAVLDAFFGIAQCSSGQEVYNRLTEAWAQDPSMTLRLIFNLRSIHEGKNALNVFFHAFACGEDMRRSEERCRKEKWEQAKLEMQSEPDKTSNEEFLERPARSHGCWKDLLSVVSLAFHDQLGNPQMTPDILKSAFGPAPVFRADHADCNHPMTVADRETPAEDSPAAREEHAQLVQQMAQMHLQEWQAKAKDRRHEQRRKMSLALEEKLNSDPKFRSIYVTVARLFADVLAHDISTLVEIVRLRKTSAGNPDIASQIRKLSNTISLAGKWAPSTGKTFDRQFLMTSAIAQILFPNHGQPGSSDQEEQIIKARNMLRRFVLTPLRDFLAVPESKMHPGKWDKISYPQVPAVCFTSNKSLFWYHDPQRFVHHLEAVGKGARTLSGSSLLPHEILISAMVGNAVDVGEAYRPSASGRRAMGKMVKARYERTMKESIGKLYSGIYDAQWSSMMEHITSLGALDNCIAVCDVSGSMGSVYSAANYVKNGQFNKSLSVQPIFPALALSILVAQIASPPWKNMFITFSAHPNLVELQAKSPDGSAASLAEIASAMSTADWGQNTNFASVFRYLLLPTAKRHKLAKDQMVKRVFVFSDMQFDSAQYHRNLHGAWETVHQTLKLEFEREGYDLPELVYWNLAGGRYNEGMGLAAPVNNSESGVSLMSGFSGSMLKAFIGQAGDEADAEPVQAEHAEQDAQWDDADVELQKPGKKKEEPADKMKRVLSGKSYAGLTVYD